MTFGEILKKYRNSLELSVNKLSKLSNVSVGYISKIENGQRKFPSDRILFLLLVGFKNSKLKDQSISIKEVDNEIKEILYEYLSADDSEIIKENFETIYNNFITFYEDMHEKVGNTEEKNRKKNIFVYEEEKKKNSLKMKKPINDIGFHLNDSLNQKFFNGVLLNDNDKYMIKQIIHLFLINKIKQEDDYLSKDIEQLQKEFNDFRKDAMLNEKQVKMFANHNNIQSLKENDKK